MSRKRPPDDYRCDVYTCEVIEWPTSPHGH